MPIKRFSFDDRINLLSIEKETTLTHYKDNAPTRLCITDERWHRLISIVLLRIIDEWWYIFIGRSVSPLIWPLNDPFREQKIWMTLHNFTGENNTNIPLCAIKQFAGFTLATSILQYSLTLILLDFCKSLHFNLYLLLLLLEKELRNNEDGMNVGGIDSQKFDCNVQYIPMISHCWRYWIYLHKMYFG